MSNSGELIHFLPQVVLQVCDASKLRHLLQSLSLSNFACRAFMSFSFLISRFRFFEFVISSMFSQSFLVENAEEPSHNFSSQTVQLCIFILQLYSPSHSN